MTAPKPFTCAGGTVSWWDLTISGRIGGHHLTHRVSTCWTPQMATLKKLGLASSLGRHVLPRRHGVVLPGLKRTFAPPLSWNDFRTSPIPQPTMEASHG